MRQQSAAGGTWHGSVASQGGIRAWQQSAAGGTWNLAESHFKDDGRGALVHREVVYCHLRVVVLVVVVSVCVLVCVSVCVSECVSACHCTHPGGCHALSRMPQDVTPRMPRTCQDATRRKARVIRGVGATSEPLGSSEGTVSGSFIFRFIFRFLFRFIFRFIFRFLFREIYGRQSEVPRSRSFTCMLREVEMSPKSTPPRHPNSSRSKKCGGNATPEIPLDSV